MLMKWEKAHNKKISERKFGYCRTCGTRSGVRTLDTLIKSGTRCVLFIFIVIYLRPFNHVKMALHSHLFMFILYKKGFLKNT